jgi:Tfp pilus assembly protein PilF
MALSNVNEALKKYPAFYKFWLIKAQIQESLNQIEEAHKTYDEALQTEGVKQQKLIWICFARFETSH